MAAGSRSIRSDENKQSIIADFRELRDFFAEVSPSSNNTVPPQDVRDEIKKWQQEAEASDRMRISNRSSPIFVSCAIFSLKFRPRATTPFRRRMCVMK